MSASPQAAKQSQTVTLSTGLARRVKEQIEALRTRGAKNGARRLAEVVQHFQYYTVEGAAQYIHKDEIIDELESQPHKVLSVLRFGRNVLSVAPIVITWLALFFAANAYASDLATTPNDVYQPFLLLWQEGFHNRIPPFSDAALADFLLLSLLVVIIVIIPFRERSNRNRLHQELKELDLVIEDLLAEIGRSGADARLADADVAKLSEAIEKSIQTTLGRLMLQYDRVAEEARQFVEKTNESTRLLVKNFDENLVVFNSDVRLLTSDLQKVDQNLQGYGLKLQVLSDASLQLAGSSTDLAQNAKSLVDSAQLNVQASQGISARLSDLNTAQQEIIKTQKEVVQELTTAQRQVVSDVTASQQTVVQKIADSQKEVVTELTGAADVVERSGKNTRDAASNLERVAVNLEQLTRADFQTMADGVKQANQDLVAEVRQTSAEFQRMLQGLTQIDAHLQQTTQALATASQTMNQTTGKTSPAGSFASKLVLSLATGGTVAILVVAAELAVLLIRGH